MRHSVHHRGPALNRPLVEELSPPPDPWLAARRLADLPRLLFLDSATPGTTLGRYSFLCADPYAWLVRRGTAGGDPFSELGRLVSPPFAPADGLPPFQGGAAGLFSYDLCQIGRAHV